MAYGKQNLVICYSNPVSCDCLRQVLHYQNRKPEITVGRMVCKCYSGGHRPLGSELCRWFCVLDKESDWWLLATLENAQSRKALCNKSPSDQCCTQKQLFEPVLLLIAHISTSSSPGTHAHTLLSCAYVCTYIRYCCPSMCNSVSFSVKLFGFLTSAKVLLCIYA